MIVNLLRQVQQAPLATKEQAMALVRRWDHPHHRAAGVCLLRISCAFPVLEPAQLAPPEVADSARRLLQLPVRTLFSIRRRSFSLFCPE